MRSSFDAQKKPQPLPPPPLPEGFQQSSPPELGPAAVCKANRADPDPVPAKKLAVKLESPAEQASLTERFHSAVSAATTAVTRTANVLSNATALALVSSGLDASLSRLSKLSTILLRVR